MKQFYMANPFQHWIDFHMMIGVNWRCELCSSKCHTNNSFLPPFFINYILLVPQAPPTAPPTLAPGYQFTNIEPECTCVGARVWYYLKYNDVAGLLMDPAMHYEVCQL